MRAVSRTRLVLYSIVRTITAIAVMGLLTDLSQSNCYIDLGNTSCAAKGSVQCTELDPGTDEACCLPNTSCASGYDLRRPVFWRVLTMSQLQCQRDLCSMQYPTARSAGVGERVGFDERHYANINYHTLDHILNQH